MEILSPFFLEEPYAMQNNKKTNKERKDKKEKKPGLLRNPPLRPKKERVTPVVTLSFFD